MLDGENSEDPINVVLGNIVLFLYLRFSSTNDGGYGGLFNLRGK
jgi:hypothetical protein